MSETPTPTTIDFEAAGKTYTADFSVAENPTPKFLRLTKKMGQLADKGDNMTDDEGVESILLASDYLAVFGIDADDLPADELFEVLAALFEAVGAEQDDEEKPDTGNRAQRRAATKSKA